MIAPREEVRRMAPELRTCCDLILSTVEIKRDKATQVQCNVATENRHLELLLSEHLFPADNSNVSQKGSDEPTVLELSPMTTSRHS